MVPAELWFIPGCGSYLVGFGSKSSHSFAELHMVTAKLGKNLILTYFIQLSTSLSFLDFPPLDFCNGL
jgi:hypothetical protein